MKLQEIKEYRLEFLLYILFIKKLNILPDHFSHVFIDNYIMHQLRPYFKL